MKLKECYIDNFGKLSNFKYEFSDGLNTICEENGYGKSTLIAFIKAMLFGLDDTKKTKLDENERKKYEPWQGGAWGGSLSLAAGGRCLRVERRFSKKASEDECRVYDEKSGKLLDAYSDKLGEEIFGIDRDGFERTVFFSEKILSEKCENKSIAAKLSDLSGVECDLSALDDALDILDDERKYYYKQGGGGAIGDINSRLSSLEFKKSELKALYNIHENDEAVIVEQEKKLSSLRSRLSSERVLEGKRSVQKELYSSYLAKKKELERETEKLDELSGFFKAGYPTKDELYEAATLEKELMSLYDAEEKAHGETKELPKHTHEELEEIAESSRTIAKKEEEIKSLEADRYITRKRRKTIRAVFACLGSALLILSALLGVLVSVYLFALIIPAVLLICAVFFKRDDGFDEKIKKAKLELEDCLTPLKKFKNDMGVSQELKADELILKAKESLLQAELVERQAKERAQRTATAEEKYFGFVKKYPTVSENPINEISSKLTEAEISASIIDRLLSECKEFESKYSFNDFNPENLTEASRYDALSAILSEEERKLTTLRAKFRNDAVALEELDEINAEYERLTELLTEYKNRLSIIKKTKDYLEMAKDAINTKYLSKTKESFLMYSELITQRSEDIALDTSLSLSLREGGLSKPKEAYSKGTRELYSFALRLALADALYADELPFIILDDPFAYYDDGKLARAISLIKELSKNRQIIYLTASKSRIGIN